MVVGEGAGPICGTPNKEVGPCCPKGTSLQMCWPPLEGTGPVLVCFISSILQMNGDFPELQVAGWDLEAGGSEFYPCCWHEAEERGESHRFLAYNTETHLQGLAVRLRLKEHLVRSRELAEKEKCNEGGKIKDSARLQPGLPKGMGRNLIIWDH